MDCAWCDKPVSQPARGRRRRYCSPECKAETDVRRRWLKAERARLAVDLARRQAAVPRATDRAHALRWVESVEARLARADEEIAALG